MIVVRKLSILSMLLVMLASLQSFAADTSISVIVHPDNANQLTERQVRYLFLGKSKTFPDGSKAKMFDLPDTDDDFHYFIKKVLRKSEANLNAYWARMLFSSKGEAPKRLNSQDEVIAMVAKNPSAIAYVNTNKVDSSVKSILVIDR